MSKPQGTTVSWVKNEQERGGCHLTGLISVLDGKKFEWTGAVLSSGMVIIKQ